MDKLILGLDIGGANLKLATSTGIARIVPFALWKEPDKLSEKLAMMLAEFPDAEAITVTMTGESCDCYETKREGVLEILNAVERMSQNLIQIWNTDGYFHSLKEARVSAMTVASANWHGLTTYIAKQHSTINGILIDIGSTTSDVIPFATGEVVAKGMADYDRLGCTELIYTGVKRTPITSYDRDNQWCAELFATTLDAYNILEKLPEDHTNRDTADGRPATRDYAHARLARMLGGDGETVDKELTWQLAYRVNVRQVRHIQWSIEDRLREHGWPDKQWIAVISGCGEFLAREALLGVSSQPREIISLSEELGPELSTVAPAYALTQLLNQAEA